MPQSRRGPHALDYTRLEGGLSERQKSFIRDRLVDLMAEILQHEAVVPGSIATYDDLFRLTRDEHFLPWQEMVLGRGVRQATPASTVLGLVVQLRQVDLDLQAARGYLEGTRAIVATVLARLLQTANSIFVAHGGRVPMIITTDKDGNEWQMYTAASAPDSAIVRRKQPKVKSGPRRRPKKAKRPFHAAKLRAGTTTPPPADDSTSTPPGPTA